MLNRVLLRLALPLPRVVTMHDWWLAQCGGTRESSLCPGSNRTLPATRGERARQPGATRLYLDAFRSPAQWWSRGGRSFAAARAGLRAGHPPRDTFGRGPRRSRRTRTGAASLCGASGWGWPAPSLPGDQPSQDSAPKPDCAILLLSAHVPRSASRRRLRSVPARGARTLTQRHRTEVVHGHGERSGIGSG
jgi:hypothetical protein